MAPLPDDLDAGTMPSGRAAKPADTAPASDGSSVAAGTGRADVLRSRLLAMVSQQLRTPLTPALTMVQFLEREEFLPGFLRDALAIIRRSIELEIHVIDDFLDVNRIISGKVQLQQTVVDLHAQLSKAVQMLDSDLRAKRQTLATQFQAHPHHARVDRVRIQHVFWNLLKNAIEFTPEGGAINIRTWNEGDHVVIACTDTGMGIPAGALPRVFDALDEEEGVTQPAGGRGLGLAITKALVEAHGGTLEAASPGVGRGATFTVRLASAHADQDVQPSKGAQGYAAPEGSRRETRVLLVEDHADTARAFSRLLRSWGYTVRTAGSLAAAVQAFKSEPFDLLISDIGLPDGSGLDLLREIRRTRPIRGIALTGYGADEDVRLTHDAGFERHLTKPVDIEQLESAIAAVTKKPPPIASGMR